MASFLKGQDFITIDSIKSKEHIDLVFERADKMKTFVEKHQVYESLKGRSVAVLFYQPSTRTFSSFVAAAKRLGAYVVDIHGMTAYSSVTKGETLEDTIQTIQETTAADAIVLRHPDDNSGEVATSVSRVPILNAGSGKAEHPSQAMLDMYTIYNQLGRMDNLHVVMVGDMLYGRTVKSLAKLLAVTGNNKITCVAPKELKMPESLITSLKGKVTFSQTEDLEPHLKSADVVYMTRVQKEWFEHSGKLEQYERLKDNFILDNKLTNKMPQKSIVLHPLPRVGEILHEVDSNPRAKYFTQRRSGLYVRMALLDLILED